MNIKRKIALVITWGFVLLCMVIIFSYSNQIAELSQEVSDGWIKKIFETFGVELSSHTIRKLAHATEFGGLCFAFNTAYAATYLRFCPLLSIISTVFYASTDEIHQYFIEGRACQLRDVFVDFCGAAAVTLVLSIIYFIYIEIKKKREEKICQF